MGFWSRLFGSKQSEPAQSPSAAAPTEEPAGLEHARALFLHEVLAIVRADERVDSAHAVRDDFAIQIGDGENAMTLFLHNAFLELREVPPEERASRVRTLLGSMLDREPPPETWDDVAPLLRAAVRPMGYFGPLAHAPEGLPFLVRPCLPFLVETVVVDYPDKMAGVTLENVRKWGVSREEVFERARANLAEMPTALSSYDGPDGSIQIVDMGDHYEAARLLVPPLLLEIAKSFAGRPVIAIPHRSVMLVTDDARDEHVLRLAETAQREYASSPRSLSPALYTIDQDGRCAPYVREGRTEVANAVARGHYQLAAGEFADQKAALDKAYEADGTDVYVAAFDIIRVKNDGHYFSYTVWAENVDSLLPRADYVGLTDGDGKPCFVPWETARRLVGDCWELDAKLDPARVRTVRWPDQAVLEELRANAVRDL